MTPEHDKVDMSSLTQKELLILINHQVMQLYQRLTTYDKDNLELKLKVNVLETKMKLWAAVIGLLSSGLMSLLFELFKH